MKTKLISILLVVFLLVGSFSALVSCDFEGNKNDTPTQAVTETPTEAPTGTSADTNAEVTTDAFVSETTPSGTDGSEESVSDVTEILGGSETESETQNGGETLTETEVITETESETEAETEPEGPSEPLCETCKFKTVKGKPVCSVCGFVALCRGEHGYTADLDGHWKPACEHCGKEAGKSQNHEYEERVVDEGDLLVYSFRCTICKFKAYEQDVPYEINAFYSAGDLAYTDISGALESKFRFESGVGYASYSSEEGGSSTVIVVSNGEVGDSSGRYLVMKVRLPASQSSFVLNIKSVGAYGHQKLTFTGLKSIWTTLIVDVTKATSIQNVTDKETGISKDELIGYHDMNGEYFLGDLRFTAKVGAGESFDVAYVMMCETIEDAMSFTEDDKNRVVYNDILNEKPETDSKQCVDENGVPIIHEYIINDDGTHTLVKSCHQCGLAAVSHEPHIYGQIIDENGDYTYACGACGHSKYGVAVNKYLSADELNSSAPTYYRINRLGIFEDESGFDYMSISGQGGTAQIIFARASSVASDAERAGSFCVGKGNMFVIRMRTNTPSVSFGIQFSTENGNTTNLRFPTAVAENGWATYVVDLASVIPGSYIADENGEYTISNFYFHIGGSDFNADVIYDIDFAAFVDQWDEVKAIVSDETLISVTGSNMGGWVKTADKSCVGEHSFKVDSASGNYKVVCGSCGFVYKEYNVPSNIEKFMPGETLVGISSATGKIDRTLMSEGEGADSVSFVRLDNMKINNDREGWMGWNIISSGGAPVTGQYMIMKFRLPADQLGQTTLEMYTSTKLALAAGMKVNINVSEDNEWHTVVIDLSKSISDPATYFQADEDGYHVRYLQMRLFSGHQSKAVLDENGNQVKNTYTNSNGETKEYNVVESKPTAEMYMDIAYIAYCDNLGDVSSIIDSETYDFYEASGTSSIRNTADGSCFTHSYSDVVNGETHQIICSGCGDVARTFTVSEDVNYYADLGKMNHFNSVLSKGMYDDENQIVFNRYEGTAAAHLNLTGGGGAGTWTKDKYQTGNYIVIKYRAASGILTLNVSTKDNGNSKAFPNDLTRPEYSIVGIKNVSAENAEWAVALIEMNSDVVNYTTNSEQEIGIMISASGTYLIDIAYVAVVDSVDEANTLLIEGETFENGWVVSGGENGGDQGGSEGGDQGGNEGGDQGGNEGGDQGGNEGGDQGGTTPTPSCDHNITETIANGESGELICTYACSLCDFKSQKTIPASILGYFSASRLASKAVVYYQIGDHRIAADDNGAFARFTGADKTSQALWLRVQADCDNKTTTGGLANAQNIDIGESRYMVIRARTNQTSHSFKINMSTTGYNSPTATSVTGSEGKYNINGESLKVGDLYATASGYINITVPLVAGVADEWTVYVVDLSLAMGKYFAKDSETDTYVLDTFYFHFDSFASSTSLDVDYISFVEEWADIDPIVDEETVVKVVSNSGSYANVKASDGSCTQHAAQATVVDGVYVSMCITCGEKLADYNVKADALGGFISAEMLTIGGQIIGSFDREYLIEDGVSFVRIDNSKTNGASAGNWTGFNIVGVKGESYVGQYMVIKFRIGENGLSQSLLTFYASTIKNALHADAGVSIKASEDGQWHTVVVDLSTRVKAPENYFVAEDGVYTVRYLQMRPFSGAQTTAEADDYMDISYIGFFDSMDDVNDVVGDSYEMSLSSSNHTVVNVSGQ